MAMDTAGPLQNNQVHRSPQLSDEMKGYIYAANSSRIALRVWDEVFSPQEKARLGRTLEEAYRSFSYLTEMWAKVRGGTVPRAAIEILFTLEGIGPKRRRSMLQQLGEEGEDSEATLEIAIQSGCLVLADNPREVYWETEKVDVDWGNKSALWEYLLAVCKASKVGDRLDSLTFECKERTMVHRKSRLLKTAGFPSSLASRFGNKAKANQLNLLPAEIRIFERTIEENLNEWGA